MFTQCADFTELLGKVLVKINVIDVGEIIFTTNSGEQYRLLHYQDCCEDVTIDDICGNLLDLLETPILQAEVVTSNENPEGVTKEYQYSYTWTFYKLATIKGSVTIRWYGESNGYYSEEVDFIKVEEKEKIN